MYKDGEREPALIGPWTMGRNKKDPKPLDVNAFHTLIKTASEVITRHEQSQYAKLNKSVSVDVGDARWKVARAHHRHPARSVARLSSVRHRRQP